MTHVGDVKDSPVEAAADLRSRATTLLPAALVLSGCLVTAISLVADFLGVSSPGLGGKQIAAAALGALSVVAGGALSVRLGQRSWQETAKFAVIAAEVGLIALALRSYDIENIGFSQYLVVLIFCGFIANHFLPPKLRIGFFLALSLAGLFGVLQLVNGLLILGIGAGLIGVCHLKAPMAARIAILIGAAAALAALRLDWIRTEWAGAVLPILASMFMFRLSIYLYDVAHGKGPKSWTHRLAYFFMLPNAAFPFFPVVDFASFGRNYYNEEALRIYERGALWMLRGLVHLLLYRIVSYYLVPEPGAVDGLVGFLWYATANFFLYLKISGLFHLIVGVLLLFGFNLPETHKRYYFSSSFIDFWRRINIFWKDYMQKMVFTPSFVALTRRGVGQDAAIIVSMLIVFFATWALHAYQWFWIRGSTHFSAPDAFFWGFLAVMLVAQTHFESRLAARRAAPSQRRLLGHGAMLVARTAATMLTIVILWSIWTAASFGEWRDLVEAAGFPSFRDGRASLADIAAGLAAVAAAALVLMLAIGFTFGIGPHASEAPRRPVRRGAPQRFFAPAGARLAVVGVILALQVPAITAPFSAVQQFALDLGTSKLNARDAAAIERGYYEALTDVNRFNTELWALYAKRPTGWVDIRDTEAARDTGDYRQYELRPSASIIYKGAPFQTNRWGMRDRHYAMEKPAGAFRVALIGDSRAMGYGVADPDTFDTMLEDRLNAEFGGGRTRFEILNFGVADYKPVQRLMTLEGKALAFKPDAFLYTGHFSDFESRHLAEAVKAGTALPFPELAGVVRKSGAEPAMKIAEIRRRIEPFEDEIVAAAFRRMIALAEKNRVAPIFVYLPSLKEYSREERAQCEKLIAMAKEAGFITLDLSSMFEGEDLAPLRVAEWDFHPNAAGNRLIADRLFDLLASDARTASLMALTPPNQGPAISQ